MEKNKFNRKLGEVWFASSPQAARNDKQAVSVFAMVAFKL